ncbi:MAG TPA: bifunctional 5,10-methylenetetrahydrofolate dehydrogenase/5,10-methenyltetrahydrofolate cyclohydrolase [Candidatus Marinimicrobia bacterium]|jgi:methylenetetrahydrofolate dehydrogenase (NADP+)/methenyltetrahydrofolate cyclohydrolase|nr:bifunctional 5,10-methylenetetrahydrofolate dehydrogenase/5,10-methenyltetrahydrofolate cyclohydrolase [Candidatus Neomarinimicrobiota bacterium]HPN74460.1 bifunctional 5,10-methylenetetrahydrofolate dehydrogenase/5,10-methenyltetrahydrofolate cyclohydrolase [Candidatus Neomarinimicrobiota bacterium]HPY00462.1 bifunctional 5,10-methylenetetrahydrofolate dehydrogenase/5,10-methenyltetrahydrofolate cyclohydrolase [Candidatus Neomarinimicrobiota bacterium]HQO74087.1 bifunctional 5,10-methylenete
MSNPKLINGVEIAQKVKDDLRPRINRLKQKGITPGLAVILVGDNPASQSYVNMKAKAFESMQLFSETIRLPGESSQEKILDLVNQLNHDSRFHGILVQLPVPKHLDSNAIIQAISADKDADGIHPTNLGKMVLGIEAPLPCTPHGILMLLKYSDIDPAGKHVVITGRSNIVGKPIANLLMQKRPLGNATVTVCHTHTRNLPEITRLADILIAALGQPEFIDRSFVKPGVVVIDVGSNRIEDASSPKGYRWVGDVKFSEVAEIASAITPVPGGVGPMTIAMLIANTVLLAEKTS